MPLSLPTTKSAGIWQKQPVTPKLAHYDPGIQYEPAPADPDAIARQGRRRPYPPGGGLTGWVDGYQCSAPRLTMVLTAANRWCRRRPRPTVISAAPPPRLDPGG